MYLLRSRRMACQRLHRPLVRLHQHSVCLSPHLLLELAQPWGLRGDLGPLQPLLERPTLRHLVPMPLPLGRPHPMAQEVGSHLDFARWNTIRQILRRILHPTMRITVAKGLAGFAGATGFSAATGTQLVPFTKTQDTDSSTSGGTKTTISFNHISAMKAYEAKSAEELRWEDYQVSFSPRTSYTTASYHHVSTIPALTQRLTCSAAIVRLA